MRVTLIAVQSLDGFITKHATPGSAFASAADQNHLRKTLVDFDCSVMGAETYRTTRDWIRERMRAPRMRIVLTRTPQNFAPDARSGVLEFSAASPIDLLKELSARGHQRCALLGGAQIYSLFLKAALVDELWLTIEPCLFGAGTPLVSEALDIRLRHLSTENLTADTALSKYEVLR
jgi:dihydrofolate reductase